MNTNMKETTQTLDAARIDQINEHLLSIAKHKKSKNVISAREVWTSYVGDDKPIYWIKSYKTLLKYISSDYVDIFKPITLGSVTGTRYYVKHENIALFIHLFEGNKLKDRVR